MYRTSRLIQSVPDGLKLGFKLLVLQGKPPVGILQQRFKILYPFISGEQLSFGNTSFLLESRVLVDKLEQNM